MSDLSYSFQKAKEINDMQKEKLKKEVYKDQEIVNSFVQQIMWGESKSSIIFDSKKDYNLSNNDAECYYAQALQHIEEGTAWWKR
jgi:hypothetical protein